MTEENQENQEIQEGEEIDTPPPKRARKTTPRSVSPVIKNVYSTNVFQRIGLKTCSVCGEKKRTNRYGEVFCPQKNPNCPIIIKEEN
jgi:hypothetical protein